MDRRHFLAAFGGFGAISLLGRWHAPRGRLAAALGAPAVTTGGSPDWRKLLSPEAYDVLFREATERPFSSPLLAEHRPGTFLCAACYQPLFDSATKYDSGTGWPSFYDVLPGRIATKRDFKLVVPRTEYHCNHCGGHQGHVFEDGPPPTGKRYCNNGVALRFLPAGTPLPPLRG